MSIDKIRNVAIIAHVDHGKTTLVDQLLKEGTTQTRSTDDDVGRLLDSNDLEKERGITILAKCTSIEWQGIQFNIVDTPGHADFGGEVERIMTMVDGVLLLVDAAEGVMPQTKFVLTKALEQNLKPIVVINKMDRPDGRPNEVIDEVLELFMNLNADDDQLDFPGIYASAKNGWATLDADKPQDDMKVILETIKTKIPAPAGDVTAPFSFLVTMIDSNPYLGRVLTGRIYDGGVKVNQSVRALDLDGKIIDQGRITKIFEMRGIQPVHIEEAKAGQIVSLTGLTVATVANTIADPSIEKPLPSKGIDPPTIAMTFSINDSPLVGREGKKLTSRMIRDRLMQEKEKNISIQVNETENKDAYQVSGRGELQLGILIETMRREGFELSVSRPRVLFQTDEQGNKIEPIEEVKIDVDEGYVGAVVENLGLRKGELQDMSPLDGNRTRLTFLCPARGLIGFRSELLTQTRGTGVMHKSFSGFAPYKGPIEGRRNGVLVSNSPGKTTSYALFNLEDRGILFIDPSEDVYEGMIIGEHSRDNDLDVNPIRGKKLTNVRASGKDEGIRLTPPRRLSLEQALSYIEDDELVEVTPNNIRLRKKYLDPNARKRHSKKSN
jgi:GTP-binding protein